MLEEIAKQLPSLVGLIIVVGFFLKHLTQKNKSEHESQIKFTEAMLKNAEAITSLKVLIEERIKC